MARQDGAVMDTAHQLRSLMPAAGWVLVKGWHDSGTIEAVLGPYTKERAEWIKATLLDESTYNWTVIELQGGPE